MKVVYRRYASLFFLVGIDDEEVSLVLHLIKRWIASGNMRVL